MKKKAICIVLAVCVVNLCVFGSALAQSTFYPENGIAAQSGNTVPGFEMAGDRVPLADDEIEQYANNTEVDFILAGDSGEMGFWTIVFLVAFTVVITVAMADAKY